MTNGATTTVPVYDTEIRVARLTVPGCETRAFTWNPTVGSRVLAGFQRRELPGVQKVRFWIHRPTATWRMQVAASPAGHAAVAEMVRVTVASESLESAR